MIELKDINEQLKEGDVVKAFCETCGKDTFMKIIIAIDGTCGICSKCKHYTMLKKNPNYRPQSDKPTVECPYCHSTNTKKITNLSKAAHTAMFGIFSIGRNSKEWHCNNCNSDF